MEKSKPYKDVLELGKILVEELGLEQSVDTLGRWMAHYISELIVEVEKTEGSDKSDVEERCRDAILALWKHVREFPEGRRPLMDVEPILATLKAIEPENQAYFYISDAQSQINESTLSGKAKELLDMCLGIDYSARLLMVMCLQYAANEIAEAKQDLLQLAESLDADTPITVVVRSLSEAQGFSEKEQQNEDLRKRIELLENRRDRLQSMVQTSESLALSIEEEIKSVEQQLV